MLLYLVFNLGVRGVTGKVSNAYFTGNRFFNIGCHCGLVTCFAAIGEATVIVDRK